MTENNLPNDPIESLEREIMRSFEQLGYPQLQGLICESDGNEVTLSGSLESFYLKQVAQSVAVKVAGVNSVKNRITVE